MTSRKDLQDSTTNKLQVTSSHDSDEVMIRN